MKRRYDSFANGLLIVGVSVVLSLALTHLFIGGYIARINRMERQAKAEESIQQLQLRVLENLNDLVSNNVVNINALYEFVSNTEEGG